MKKFHANLLFLSILLSAFAFSGCEEDDGGDDVPALSNEEFMQFAAVSNLFEIQSSQLATQKATTAEVLEFANDMIADHTRADSIGKALAAAKNITLPTTLPQDKQAIINRLNGETGVTFEKDYMNAQVTSHEETVAMFERASQEVPDADIRAFATQQLPVLRQHESHAKMVKEMTDAL